jgi:hypothetical protein
MKARKPETIIADLKRQLKRALAERNTYHDGEYIQRERANRAIERASKAEQDYAEWKGRFDMIMLVLTQDARDKMAGQPGVFGK